MLAPQTNGGPSNSRHCAFRHFAQYHNIHKSPFSIGFPGVDPLCFHAYIANHPSGPHVVASPLHTTLMQPLLKIPTGCMMCGGEGEGIAEDIPTLYARNLNG